ncbi:MAG TPA: guanylate kinase [Pyrinomonadaceae bacterium]|nr:guanylate kinase [Pyrinomonadaceae bacterium]
MTGSLIIISSPSGGGKGTLIKEVMETVPDVGYSVSYTTRRPRAGEEHGRHYYFVSSAEFQKQIEADGFLEYAEVHGNLYGTSREQTERMTTEGKDVILEIDVQGADAVMKKVPSAVSIFILPPSFEVLKARLTTRATEGSDELALRLGNSYDEVRQYSKFSYVIVNDEVMSAARSLASIIQAERQRKDRQTEAIKGILDSFDPSKSMKTGE